MFVSAGTSDTFIVNLALIGRAHPLIDFWTNQQAAFNLFLDARTCPGGIPRPTFGQPETRLVKNAQICKISTKER